MPVFLAETAISQRQVELESLRARGRNFPCPHRVLSCSGSGSTSGVIAGVDWVTAHHISPAVANMSLGGGVSTALDTAVRGLLDERIGAVGYGIPSNLDRSTRVALQATNLPLQNLDLRAHAQERFGLPVGIENDGNAAALWGHFSIFGVNSKETSVSAIIGTGLGGGVIIDGNIVVKGRVGFGGELRFLQL